MHRQLWVSCAKQSLKQKGLGMWTSLCVEYVRVKRTMETNGQINFSPNPQFPRITLSIRGQKEMDFKILHQSEQSERFPALFGSEKYLSLAGLGHQPRGSSAALIRGSNIVLKAFPSSVFQPCLLQIWVLLACAQLHTARQPLQRQRIHTGSP